MPAFPYYDTPPSRRLNDQAVALLKLFGARGYAREEPSVLQPAEIFLDRSGEEIRRRTFTLMDPSGRDLALRPDLTIPICREAVLAERSFPARISYNGLVFRHQPGEPHRPTQFFQAGVELLGLEDRAAGEREILSLVIEALRVAGLKDFSLRIGDVALFSALVDALALPKQWRWRLKRHFWRAGYVENLIQWLAHGAARHKAPGARRRLEAMLEHEDRCAACGPHAGGDHRPRPGSRGRGGGAAPGPQSLLRHHQAAGYFRPGRPGDGRNPRSAEDRRHPARGAACRHGARLAALKSLGVEPGQVQFAAHFGRNMEYYTGLVFELWARDKEGPVQIAGGGRYDTLLETLGAKQPVSAIGCAIRTERVLAVKGAA